MVRCYLKCDQCGEKNYTDSVAEKLEGIVKSVKKRVQEIAVVYNALTA